MDLHNEYASEQVLKLDHFVNKLLNRYLYGLLKAKEDLVGRNFMTSSGTKLMYEALISVCYHF
jgi:hypothetical protein